MTSDELEQRLRDWYRAEIGDREAAPEALHASVGTIPETIPGAPARIRQGRGFVLLVAATLLLTVLIGASIAIGSGLLPPPWAVEEAPTATLEPHALPQEGRRLDARPYTMAVRDQAGELVGVTVTAPDGWTSDVPNGSVGGMRRGYARFHVAIVESVYASRCPPTTMRAVGPSVDDLTSALASIDRVEASAPTDIVVSGYRGKRIEVTIPDDDCVGAGSPPSLWTNRDGSQPRRVDRGDHLELLILDVAGARLVIDVSSSLAAPTSRVPAIDAELRGIVESIHIDKVEAGS